MPRTPALDTGDEYEFSVSSLVRPRPGVEMWISVRARGTVREGETGGRAARRIEVFVEDRLNRKVEEVMAE